MEPGSILSTLKKLTAIRKAAGTAVDKSEKVALLTSFAVETSEQSLQLLDMLLAACRQRAEEADERPAWLDALEDDSMPAAARVEALTVLKDDFLKLLRAAHDPALGNKMLALATAGLSGLGHPEAIEARVLIIAAQLVPEDVALLYRYYVSEGTSRIERSPNGLPVFFPRRLVQEDYVLRFLLDEAGAETSEPLDSYAYNALKKHDLLLDYPWLDPARPRGKPPALDFRPQSHRFKLEWEPTFLGQVVLEAFLGRSLVSYATADDTTKADGGT